MSNADRARRVKEWLDGGCSSWGIPVDDIAALTLSASVGVERVTNEHVRVANAAYEAVMDRLLLLDNSPTLTQRQAMRAALKAVLSASVEIDRG